jgi:ferritin-like metal-binding protein YciE
MKTKKILTPHDLFFDQLRDLYSMEDQLCDAMPTLAALSSEPGLRATIQEHSSETTAQFSEILCIFDRHGVPTGDDKCQAMSGLIQGGESHLEKVPNKATRDLMMIAHCLRIEHYELAAYEITRRLASRLGFMMEVGVLSELLEQEQRMAATLLQLEPDIFELAGKANENVSQK